MPVWLSPHRIDFPPAHLADEEGLLAAGGDLSTARLLNAYRHGTFPWYDETTVPLWWCPDPRFVLFPNRLKVSQSMKQVLRRGEFTFTHNQAFAEVIAACAGIKRPGQHGTWITEEVELAYNQLHKLGYAHSYEAWKEGKLAGGFYGIRMGNFFFGESMFSRVSNASKAVFITFVKQFEAEGGELIDCQVETPHLASLGAEMMGREEFLEMIADLKVSGK
ncbi:MAG: leucyl/phenylalanyl-tRNA--protein transferase [Bacteroidia bacterium]|jgi:leucyl/phenylalanyl-tRNA--protein transferase|nr:leucyl/phenylalanyl-tRNA--protein transferase [Bacteroidia bacterium]